MAPGRATSIIEKDELKMNRVLKMKRKIKQEREREKKIDQRHQREENRT